MQTIPTDTRNRILAKYDAGRHSRDEVAEMFGTSLGFVKKLLSQRKRLGHCEPLYSRAGRKPAITPAHRESIRELLKHNPGAIEQMWSKVKATLRRIGARTYDELVDAINLALAGVSADNAISWFTNSGYTNY